MDQNSQNNPNIAIQFGEPTTPDHQNQNPTYFQDLLSGESYFKICVPLRKAALEGNWKEVNRIFEAVISTTTQYSFNDVLHMAITEGGQTILHVATGAGQTTFVEEILQSTQQHDVLLTLQDQNANNAFCFAAASGRVTIAMLMLIRKPDLPTFRGSRNKTPLHLAVSFGRDLMANVLYHKTFDNFEEEEVKALFFESINNGLYDIARKLLGDRATSALEVARNANNETALHMLARTPSAFANKRTGLFERLINSFPEMKFNCNTNSMTTPALQLAKDLTQKITQIRGQNVAKQILKESLFDAAELGNFAFLAQLVRSYPDLIHQSDEKNRTIFQIAILHRHIDIFCLIHEMGFDVRLVTSYEDNEGNNMLHLAAIYPKEPPNITALDAAEELLQELQIFKVVGKIVGPTYREKKNSKGEKPIELFRMNHEKLRMQGEKWIKSTANNCMLVATLIATVVFTSAFTIPGGTHDKTGRPIHLNKIMFKVFVMSNATAFTFSCTSILTCLSILASGYMEQQFLKSLPRKLTCGLVTLFISVMSMMVAFSSSVLLYFPYHERHNWMAISIALLASIPIILYGWLQYPLMRWLFNSTFGPVID